MFYYIRTITKREPINKYGKIGYHRYNQFFKTNDSDLVVDINKGKRIRFRECTDYEVNYIEALRIPCNMVIEELVS